MRNVFIVYLYSLAKIKYIRRSKKPRFFACGAKYAAQHRRCGALTVCAGNMNEFELFLRIPELIQQRGYSPEP